MNQIGGQMVQTAAETAKREVAPPVAAKTPAMTLPDKNARVVKPSTKPIVKEAPSDARGRTLSRGDLSTSGTTPVDTGVKGRGIGLSSAGGTGSGVRLDITGEFCCPAYLEVMKEQIERHWSKRAETPATAIMKFTIQRDGTLTDITLEKPSGIVALDLRAQRAMTLTKQLPPLPAQFTNPTLTVHLYFEYTR
jgi:TonB family protein